MGVKLHVCIPVIDENDTLPITLECLKNQEYKNFSLYICINQPEYWWDRSDKRMICERNVELLEQLKAKNDFDLILIDRCSPGHGWPEKESGVGFARRELMNTAMKSAGDEDVMVSLDADTTFSPAYLGSLAELFATPTFFSALSVPYYHQLVDDTSANRAILRYEIYMRNYALNLFRIKNPYAFTALGSAMVVPFKAYRAIGGISPKHSGEDFYFLQKLRKYAPILNYNTEKVFPAARFSDRVNFGTGPAMIKGSQGDWSSYPIYHYSLFDQVKDTYDCFASLYTQKDIESPMQQFLAAQFKESDFWQSLRKNATNAASFERACTQKVDGLRILQYLKNEQKKLNLSDEASLQENLKKFYPEIKIPHDLSFDHTACESLNELRNQLEAEELKCRRQSDFELLSKKKQ